MDLALPIASAIPSLDGPVLAVLAGTDAPLSLSDVWRVADRGSLAGVRRVLMRLTETGLVHAVPGGYVLNRDHVAAPAIDQLAQLHGVLAARIRSTLERWDGDVLLAGLFGSAARRDGDEESDIDILVVTNSPNVDELVDELAERVPAWTGNEAHVITKDTDGLETLRRNKEPIIGQWERDLLVLVGDARILRESA